VLRIEGASPEPPRKAQQPALPWTPQPIDSHTEKLSEDSLARYAVLAEEMIIETRNMGAPCWP
jgi:hypothetical protein